MIQQLEHKKQLFTKRASQSQSERGFALLVTIFGLLLLTAVAMAMIFSADSETMIAVNYRDKNSGSYSAFSGLQEARQRMQPVSGDLATLVTATPTTSNAQVLYIINPSNGETVAPWDPNNPYFDTELCQENMLGVSGTHGVACPTSAIPAGNTWYQVYDNSSHATNWKLTSPLDYKWVRVTLKQNGNTPAYVDPSASANAQVCWDGLYQDIMPTSYTSCTPPSGNQVFGLNLTNGGSMYTSTPPTVSIVGGGGNGASATAVVTPAPSDAITSVTLSSGGSGYSAPPNVTISGTDTTATFKALIASSAVTSVNINNSGANYCYSATPTVSFSASPTGQNASATATMGSATCIATASSATKCTATTAGQAYPITGVSGAGSGSGFAGYVTFGSSHKVSGISISQVGSGYSSTTSGTITITDNSNNTCTLSSTITAGTQVSSITLGSGGSYISQPTVTLSGPVAAPTYQSPTLPALTALPNPWPANASAVTAIQITSGGSGYIQGQPYTLNITPSNGVGSGATAVAYASGGYSVTGFSNIVGGSGYTTPPTVTIAAPGGGGTTAMATATIASGGVNTSMGNVYLLTSMAVTKNGAKSMAQMEVGVRPPFNLNLGGALTLPGPEPPNACLPWGSSGSSTCVFPNSGNFTMSGVDANSCGGTASPTKPAIGVYDNQSQTDVINSINQNRYQNYIGVNGTATQPSVEQVYASLGGATLTPAALNNFVQDIWNTPGTTQLSGNVSSLGTTTMSSVTAVDGNLTLSGNPNGSGILLVTGTLTFSGDFTWNGLVLVIGQGQVIHNGGGNPTTTISGGMYVAQTVAPGADPITGPSSGTLSTMGTPTFNWNGGGNNNITYDHCKADALLKRYANQPSQLPLQVLSQRTLQF